MRVGDQRTMGDVEANHRRVELLDEDALCRLRVGPDVELGSGCPVALADRAAHQDEPFWSHVGMQRTEQADVRQRTGRNECQLPAAAPELFGEEVDGVLVGRPGARSRQIRPVEARLPVHVRGDVGARTNGLSAPG